MATYVLTTGDDTRDGTSSADTFDGYANDDGLGLTGGTDTLNGLGGNDLFLLDDQGLATGGVINGGADTDTVRAYGIGLGSFTFQNVEILSVETFEFGATISQLNAFSTITTSLSIVSMPQVSFYLTGDGGSIDLSTKAGDRGFRIVGQNLNSGLDVTGTSLTDSVVTSRYDDTVHAGGGNDIIFSANRTYTGSQPQPGGNDTVFGEGGADSFYLCAQSGTYDGGTGTDTVYAFQFNEAFVNPLGNLADATFVNMERLVVGSRLTYASIEQLSAFSTITGGDASQLIWFDQRSGAGGTIDFSTKLHLAGEHVAYRGYGATSAVDVTGTVGNDTLEGSDFQDTLRGGAGNDYLVGAGFSFGAQDRDTLIGGEGSDTYYIDPTDTVIETLAGAIGGIDTIMSTGSFDLTDALHVQGEIENLTLNGYLGAENPSTNAYGNGLNNVITGNGGNNILDGRAGADQMIGKQGNDTYHVDNAGDLVTEAANQGSDTVTASVSYTLAAGQSVETLRLTDPAGTAALNLTGNEFGQRLLGNAGNNRLDGGAGGDRLYGFDGNDTYVVDTTGDRVFESANGGTDRVSSHVSYALAAGQAIETLSLADAAGNAALNLTGNELGQRLVGNAGANLIDGKDGSDILYGLGGADTFKFTTMLGAGNVDRIADFSYADDTIHLDRSIFSALGLGTLNASAFKDIGDPGAVVDADDRILYDHDTGALFYDSNGSASGGRTQFATLDNRPATVTAEDFFVIA